MHASSLFEDLDPHFLNVKQNKLSQSVLLPIQSHKEIQSSSCGLAHYWGISPLGWIRQRRKWASSALFWYQVFCFANSSSGAIRLEESLSEIEKSRRRCCLCESVCVCMFIGARTRVWVCVRLCLCVCVQGDHSPGEHVEWGWRGNQTRFLDAVLYGPDGALYSSLAVQLLTVHHV